MSSTVGTKKVKRTGESSLFTEMTGKVTDEALLVCKFCGVDPKDLYVRPIEFFMKKGVSQSEATKNKANYDTKRSDLISIVLQNMSSYNGRRSVQPQSKTNIRDMSLP